jgi:hypothetical protein
MDSSGRVPDFRSQGGERKEKRGKEEDKTKNLNLKRRHEKVAKLLNSISK